MSWEALGPSPRGQESILRPSPCMCGDRMRRYAKPPALGFPVRKTIFNGQDIHRNASADSKLQQHSSKPVSVAGVGVVCSVAGTHSAFCIAGRRAGAVFRTDTSVAITPHCWRWFRTAGQLDHMVILDRLGRQRKADSRILDICRILLARAHGRDSLVHWRLRP